MEPQHSPSNESRGVEAAPFAYGRRQSVFGTGENLAEAMRAARSARRFSSPAKERHRIHDRRGSRLDGHALDMTAAVHQRARLSTLLADDLLQFGSTGRPTSASMTPSPTSQQSLSRMPPTLRPVAVEPVSACLRGLRYTRSARAWETLAAGCVAEAKVLSEQDNDVVAWAACFILSGDAHQGLMLLESYVVATCVVVHEVHTGLLGRLPKGINPFAKKKADRAGRPVRDDAANKFVQRKCLERHNQVLMAWMRHRAKLAEHLPAALSSYDVNVQRTAEAEVRQVVLQAMQLLDAVEVHRWYIAALMLYAPTDTSSVAAAAGTTTNSSFAAAADGDDRTKATKGARKGKKARSADARGAGLRRVVDVDGGNDTDSIFSQSRSVHSTTSSTTTAGGEKAKTHTSASNGYRAPQNLWFRYFFALCDIASPDGAAAEERDDGPVTPLDAGASCGGGGGASPQFDDNVDAVLTSFEARTQTVSDDVPNSASSRQSVPSCKGPAIAPEALNGPPRLLPSVTSVAGGEEAKAPSRKGSFAFQPSGKLKRTLSWFRDRGRGSSSSQAHRSSCPSLADGPPLLSAPTWHLPATVSLDQEQTCALLLSHREEWDVYFITALTAYYTHHYRTCMMAASRFLHWAEANGGIANNDDTSHNTSDRSMQKTMKSFSTKNMAGGTSAPSPGNGATQVPGLRTYQCRFALVLRACAALQVGERLQAGKDVLTLLEEKEDSLIYHVGCALGLYGLPLPQAKDTLLAATPRFTYGAAKTVATTGPNAPAATAFSAAVQGYLYLLAESVHAATLLQLGLVPQTMTVAKTALQQAERSGLTEDDTLPLRALRDLLVIAATAVEDARAILDVPLSPHRLVYIAVSPAFFGGLCASGIRVKAQSATYRLLYPLNLPLYASTRQMIPFHMNRATYLYHSGQVSSAWDDACCAVAAVDEVVGSVEFAFSECFPLRVYHFAVHVGLALLESLLAADLEAAKACLADPDDQRAMDEKDAKLQEDELLSKEIVHICQDIVQRMQYFFPHSRITELCRAQMAIVCGGKDYLAQAVALSRRYPDSPQTQNVLTLALYFDHHIPEAVDNARKNLQAFPHSSEVIRIHHMLQEKHVTYNFNYRKLLPTPYKPGSHDRVFTKRMIIVLILLAANLIILCITAYVNVPSVRNMPSGLRYIAVRMQLPTVAPLFFAAIFVIHAIVSAVTQKNLISTLLTDLFFVNTPLNRALFCLRCIPLVNLVNAVLVSSLGNNFLFESGSATFVLYFFLGILFVPFTTRIWFLPSIDEPDVGFMSWLAILSVDIVICIFVVVPHIIAAFLEPYMLVLFYFFAPTERPGNEKGFTPPSSSIRRRLLQHAHDSKSMPQRFTSGSGSRFLHIVILKWLYVWSHCTMETRFLAEAQLEAECYRVFPLFEGETAEVLYAEVPQAPLCAAITSVEEAVDASALPGLYPGEDGRRHDEAAARVPSPSLDKPDAGSVDDAQPPHPPHPPLPAGPIASTGSLASSRSSSPSSSSSSSSSDAYYTHSSASSSGSGSSSSGSGYGDSQGSDSQGSDSRRRSRLSSSSSGDDDEGSAFDGTLLTGVRTVDAMRQLLDRTTRERPARMRHTASFVRPNMLQSLGAVFGGGENKDESDDGDDDDVDGAADGRGRATDRSASRSHLSDTLGHHHNSSTHRPHPDGPLDVGERHRGSTFAATNQFSDELFGPSVVLTREGGNLHELNSDSSSSSDEDAGHVSAAHSYHAVEEGGDPYSQQHHGVRGATQTYPSPHHRPDSDYAYPDDYAAQNGFGWYALDAVSGETHPRPGSGAVGNSPRRPGNVGAARGGGRPASANTTNAAATGPSSNEEFMEDVDAFDILM